MKKHREENQDSNRRDTINPAPIATPSKNVWTSIPTSADILTTGFRSSSWWFLRQSAGALQTHVRTYACIAQQYEG